jgi:hypothetical protein
MVPGDAAMTMPWDRPGSTGAGRGTAPTIAFEGGEHCADDRFYRIKGARRRDSLVDANSPLLSVLQDFAIAHRLGVSSNRSGTDEIWQLTFDYQRMHREIVIAINAGDGQLTFSLWGSAGWITSSEGHPEMNGPLVFHTVKEERRLSGFTEGDLPGFRAGLEAALRDARAFTTNDLEVRPVGCRPELHSPPEIVN